MIIELFSLGNIVLCNEDYTIMSALENKNWSERSIRGGVKYEFPIRQNNPLELTEHEFEKIIKESDKESIVKKLAIELDGEVHNWGRSVINDSEKELFLQSLGITILRFENKWVFDDPDYVINTIKASVTAANKQ